MIDDRFPKCIPRCVIKEPELVFTGKTPPIWYLCPTCSGCDNGSEAERRDSYGVNPIMTIYGKYVEENLYYAVDERTGVVYIMGGSYNRGYMSPALNADGTPMLRDQLKEMMQGKE